MAGNKHSDKSAEELVAEFDTGARNLVGWQKNLIPYICLLWAIYHLYAASPIPSMLVLDLRRRFFLFYRQPLDISENTSGICPGFGHSGISANEIQLEKQYPHLRLGVDPAGYGRHLLYAGHEYEYCRACR